MRHSVDQLPIRLKSVIPHYGRLSLGPFPAGLPTLRASGEVYNRLLPSVGLALQVLSRSLGEGLLMIIEEVMQRHGTATVVSERELLLLVDEVVHHVLKSEDFRLLSKSHCFGGCFRVLLGGFVPTELGP